MALLGWPEDSPSDILDMFHTTCKDRHTNRTWPWDNLVFYPAPDAQLGDYGESLWTEIFYSFNALTTGSSFCYSEFPVTCFHLDLINDKYVWYSLTLSWVCRPSIITLTWLKACLRVSSRDCSKRNSQKGIFAKGGPSMSPWCQRRPQHCLFIQHHDHTSLVPETLANLFQQLVNGWRED